MRLARSLALGALLLTVCAIPARAQDYAFETVKAADVRAVAVKLDEVEHQGRAALRLIAEPNEQDPETDARFALLPVPPAKDFTFAADIAGEPLEDDGTARGFVGLAFHIAKDLGSFEVIYIRPTNGRADDQLRRNHSTQYIAHPGYPWFRLRQETPGVYESYVDLVPGEWTRVRIKVSGTTARLYVNDASQPALIINDLKRADAAGGFGLWAGPGSATYFSNVSIAIDNPND